MFHILFWFIIIVWASASPFVKQMLVCSNGDWAAVATMYNGIAASILCFIGFAKGESKVQVDRGKFFKLALLNGFYDIFVLLAIYFCLTIQYAILANYLWPLLLVVFIARRRGEKLSKNAFVGCVMGFLGVAVILAPAIGDIVVDDIIGILFGIVAAFLWAGYSASLEEEHEKVRFFLQGVAQGVSSVAAFFVGHLTGTFNWNNVSSLCSTALILVFAIVHMALSYSFWISVVRRIGQKSSSSLYAIPILALIISTVWFGGAWNRLLWVASILVIGGIVVSRMSFQD